VFVLNRDLENERELELDWKNLAPESVAACLTLTGDDLKAFNTFDRPRRVAPQELDAPKPGRSMTLKLPAASYTVLSLKLG
jgi:alpha-L-arabinofuranosidase